MAASNLPGRTGWASWLRGQLDERGWQAIDLSRRSDGRIATSQPTRWLRNGTTPDLDSIRVVCRILGVPAVRGMLAAGHLSPEDVGATLVQLPDLSAVPKRELLAELDRRMPDDVDVPLDEQAMPFRHRLAPVVHPEGEEGQDFAAFNPGSES